MRILQTFKMRLLITVLLTLVLTGIDVAPLLQQGITFDTTFIRIIVTVFVFQFLICYLIAVALNTILKRLADIFDKKPKKLSVRQKIIFWMTLFLVTPLLLLLLIIYHILAGFYGLNIPTLVMP